MCGQFKSGKFRGLLGTIHKSGDYLTPILRSGRSGWGCGWNMKKISQEKTKVDVVMKPLPRSKL